MPKGVGYTKTKASKKKVQAMKKPAVKARKKTITARKKEPIKARRKTTQVKKNNTQARELKMIGKKIMNFAKSIMD